MLPESGQTKPRVPGFLGTVAVMPVSRHYGDMPGGKIVVELRVHGVSGTPPEAMLHCPKEFVDQVAGDVDAGFFRRTEWVDRAADPPEDGQWWRRMEAYSWGGLTSRRASRALWLLFLPFSLINLAHWMLPPVAKPRPAIVAVVLLRLLALSFTMTLLLAMAVAVLDIAMWQCTSLPYCSDGGGPLAMIGSWSMGWRLVVGALPLVAVIGVLWLLGREETLREPEPRAHGSASGRGVPEAVLLNNTPPPPGPVVTPRMRSPLARNTFWNGDDAVQCMRACHVTAWTAGLGALVLAAPAMDGHSGVQGWVGVVLVSVNALLLLISVVATAWPAATGRGGRPAPPTIRRWLKRTRWTALGVLAVSLIWVGLTFDTPGDMEPSPLPGLHNSISWLVAVQVVLLAGVVVAIAMSGIQRDTEPGYQPTLRGFTAWFVAVLGWLLGGGFSAGVGLWTAQTLGNWTYSVEFAAGEVRARNAALAGDDVIQQVRAVSAAAPLIVPPAYVWAAVASLMVLACAVAAAIRLALKIFGKGALAAIDAIAEQGDVENSAPAEVVKKIVLGRRLARLTDDGPGLIASLVLVSSALVLVAAALLFVFSVPFVDGFVRDELGNIAVGATVALVVVFVGLVAGALRNRQTRRVAAILWDVITFWPRANHPLTPPSYGGRTVFDLRLRMRELVESEDATRVVLVAHSQGTVIAAATLMQTTEPKERYPLLTFGSPLRRLYACNFPAYFGRCALRELTNFPAVDRFAPRTPRWINLWALTDPIGGWVFATRPVYIDADKPPTPMLEVPNGVDCRVFDVQQRFPRVGDYDVSREGAVCGHSGFWDRREYAKAVDVLQALVAPDSERTVDATAPPTALAR